MNDSYKNFSEYQKRPTALKFGRGLHMRFGSGGGGLNQTLNQTLDQKINDSFKGNQNDDILSEV